MEDQPEKPTLPGPGDPEPLLRFGRVGGSGHHFLPVFLLRGFTDPDCPPNRTPFLWTYRFEEKRWRKRSPENFAKKTGLYLSTTEWGETHDLLERSLSVIESSAAPIITKAIPACRQLSEAERQTFAAFVLHMGARTPAAFERAADLYKFLRMREFKKRLEGWKKNPQEWEKFKAGFNAARPGDALGEEVNPEYFDKLFEPGRFKVHVDPQEMAALSLSASWGVFPLLLDMGWAFFRTEPPLYFATSDDPCARVDLGAEKSPFPGGLARSGVQVSLPISRTQCFVAGWGCKGVEYRLATRDLVAELNRRSAHFARYFVVAPKPGFPASVEITEGRFTPKPE